MPEFRLTQDDVRALGFATSAPTMYRRHLYSDTHTFSEGGHPHAAHPHPSSGTLFNFHQELSTPVSLGHRLECNHTPQWSGEMPMIPESLPILPPPTAVNEAHSYNVPSNSINVYDSGRDGAHLGSHAAYNPSQTLPKPDLSDGQLLSPHTENLRHCPLDASSACQSFSSMFPTARFHYSGPSEVIAPPIPFNIPSHRPPSPPLSHWLPYPYPLPNYDVRIVQEGPTPSLRCTRGPQAIGYGGLRLDEEELRKALIETDGKLTVLECLWEQGHAPCHLWIKADKSCINAHIQRWHGGKPGGEKLEVDCRWASCGKRMRKESITRHILSVHLGELWECRGCGKEIGRSDAHRGHIANSNLEACRTLDALVTYSADAQVIDVSAALASGGRLQYTHA